MFVVFVKFYFLWEKYSEFAEYIKMVEHQVKVITWPPGLQAIVLILSVVRHGITLPYPTPKYNKRGCEKSPP